MTCRTAHLFIGFVAGVYSVGCGSTSQNVCDDCSDTACTDNDSCPDAGCGDGANGESEGGWECPDQIAEVCLEGAGSSVPLLFEAADFGQGTRFVDVAPWTLLSERDLGDTRTISILCCADLQVESCTPEGALVAHIDVNADTGLRAVAVAQTNIRTETWSATHFAVLCDANSCALWGASLSSETPDAELAPIPGGELPENSIVHGLWWSREHELLCSYGSGIHCFDGTKWSSPQESGTDYPLFNDMDAYYFDGASPGAIAVGNLGRIAFSGFPNWGVYWGTAYPDWLTVASCEEGYAVAGKGGAVGVMEESWHGDCTLGNEDIVNLVQLASGGMMSSSHSVLGITASGRIFVDDGYVTEIDDPCFTGQVLGATPKAVAFSCGIISNVFLMDETALYGTVFCAID